MAGVGLITIGKTLILIKVYVWRDMLMEKID